MGVDLCIAIAFDGTDEELNQLAYDLAVVVGPDWFFEHPCIVPIEQDYSRSYWNVAEAPRPLTHEVRTISRWYGAGYERGHWADIALCIRFLTRRLGPDSIAVGPDSGYPMAGADLVDWFNETEAHALEGDQGYRTGPWGQTLDDLPSNFEWPVDSYGFAMKRMGWGPDYGLFTSPASGERRVWENGRWTS